MGEIILLIVLILLNAFFAASEIAFISLNDAKIDIEAKDGNKKAKKIKKMLENPSKFLATIQIGITLAGFLSSAFAAENFAGDLAPILNGLMPVISIGVWNKIAIVIITIILSYFTLIFGELVPKRIAMKYSEKIAYGSIGIIRGISVLLAPFVKFLTFSTNLVSKIFGVSENDEETVTEEEIRMMVDVGEEKGAIDEEEKTMINNVFEFNDKIVSEIMVPRTEIYALETDLSISEAIEEMTKDEDFRYSRVPVYDETIDDIKGIVYIKDILLSKHNKNAKIKNLEKEAYFVPDSKPVNELFEELRKNPESFAVISQQITANKVNDFLSGWKMTLVGGVFLLASFILPRVGVPMGEYLAWVAIVICGLPILVGAFQAVAFEHDIKADLLVSLALIASVATKEFFAAGEVALIMQIGSLLEEYTSGKARKSIEKLIHITPQTARVLRDGAAVEIPVEEVRVGDVLSILAGETIPVDGTILAGETSIDQSVMTGESIPVDKAAGDTVSSGTVNQFGTFTMLADAVSENSALQRMVRLAKEAEEIRRNLNMRRAAESRAQDQPLPVRDPSKTIKASSLEATSGEDEKRKDDDIHMIDLN